MIKAEVVADSKNEFGDRITTMVVTFPRFILAELNTHRMLSRNSASSRAIPYEKMLYSVENNPFIPIAWQKDHKGMQGNSYFDGWRAKVCELGWKAASKSAIFFSKKLSKLNVTKQLCNRILEPFMYHTVIITATEWENMFALRCPKYELTDLDKHKWFARSKKDFLKKLGNGSDKPNNTNYLWGKPVNKLSDLDWLEHNKGQAEIHMMALAEAMWDAFNESNPKELKAGEWHIPFGDNINESQLEDLIEGYARDRGEHYSEIKDDFKIKIATARCARISYTVVGEEGKKDNYENDIILHDRLAASGHWSPFEHCAKAMDWADREVNVSGNIDFQHTDELAKGWSGNLKGFFQYRKTFKNENIK